MQFVKSFTCHGDPHTLKNIFINSQQVFMFRLSLLIFCEKYDINNGEWILIKSKANHSNKTKDNMYTTQITRFMGANMGSTWVLSAPGGPRVGPHEPCYQGSLEICCTFPWDYLVSFFWNKPDAFKLPSFASISLSATDLIEAVPALSCPASTSQRITPLCHGTLRHFPAQLNPWNTTGFHGT